MGASQRFCEYMHPFIFLIVYYLAALGSWPFCNHILTVQGEEKMKQNTVFVAIRKDIQAGRQERMFVYIFSHSCDFGPCV